MHSLLDAHEGLLECHSLSMKRGPIPYVGKSIITLFAYVHYTCISNAYISHKCTPILYILVETISNGTSYSGLSQIRTQ